ncbi:MAG: GntR family transcriptional regulator [Anaerolineae bacterium]
MPKELVTAEEIQQAVIQRITSRQYAPGERLPSVRDLADELGSNRNTVNTAYQQLEELGFIASLPGGRKGFTVSELAGMEEQSRGDLQYYFYQQSVNLVWQALASGLSVDEVRQQLMSAVNEVYDTNAVKIAFYECNVHDSHDMGKFISHALDQDVHCGLLDDLYATNDTAMQRYDLLVTTFHHLSEVMQKVPSAAEKLRSASTRGSRRKPCCASRGWASPGLAWWPRCKIHHRCLTTSCTATIRGAISYPRRLKSRRWCSVLDRNVIMCWRPTPVRNRSRKLLNVRPMS